VSGFDDNIEQDIMRYGIESLTRWNTALDKVKATSPDLIAASRRHDAPRVRFMCPKCRRLVIDVWLETGFGDTSVLMSRGRAIGLSTRATPLAHLRIDPDGGYTANGKEYYTDVMIDAERMRLACTSAKCSYSGTWQRERLLVAYAEAVALGLREIPLMS